MFRPSRPMIRPFRSSEGELHDRHGRLGGVAGGGALDRDRQDVSGPPVGLELGLLLDARARASPCRLRHSSSTFVSRASRAWAAVMPATRLELRRPGRRGRPSAPPGAAWRGPRGRRSTGRGGPAPRASTRAGPGSRREPLLDLDDLGAALGQISLLLGALGEQLLARRDARLLHLGVGLAAGVLQDPLGLALGVADTAAARRPCSSRTPAHAPRGEGERDKKGSIASPYVVAARWRAGSQISLPPGRRRPPGRAEARAASAGSES